MSDWIDEMDDKDRKAWDDFVDHARRNAVGQIAGSDVFVSIVKDEADIKFAVELGLAIMYDKPIIVVAWPGRKLPDKLCTIADSIVRADLDTEAGREKFSEALNRFVSG